MYTLSLQDLRLKLLCPLVSTSSLFDPRIPIFLPPCLPARTVKLCKTSTPGTSNLPMRHLGRHLRLRLRFCRCLRRGLRRGLCRGFCLTHWWRLLAHGFQHSDHNMGLPCWSDIILILWRSEVNGIDWIQLSKVRGCFDSNMWDKTWQHLICRTNYRNTVKNHDLSQGLNLLDTPRALSTPVSVSWYLKVQRQWSVLCQICLTWTSKCFWSLLDSWTEAPNTHTAKTQSTFAAGFLRTTSGIISWWIGVFIYGPMAMQLFDDGELCTFWTGHDDWM